VDKGDRAGEQRDGVVLGVEDESNLSEEEKKIKGKRGKGQLLINRMSNIRIREEKRREKETYKVERQHHTLIQPIL
jgi:hypothetical protein